MISQGKHRAQRKWAILYHNNGNDTEKSPHLGSYLYTTKEQGNVSTKLYVKVRTFQYEFENISELF